MPHEQISPRSVGAISAWVSGPISGRKPRHRLFCFPYAGGGTSLYHAWRKLLAPSGIEVCGVQLPGREARLLEPPARELGLLVDQLGPSLQPYMDVPFSFFGHSMGALICFELTRHLVQLGWALPEHLLISGALAPHRRQRESLHTLPESEFLDAVAGRYQGIPKEVFQDRELRELVMPILRADFELIERYRFTDGAALPVRLTVFGGRDDPTVPPEELEHWRKLTAQPDAFRVQLFDGDHFFLRCQSAPLAHAVLRCLA